MNIFSNKGRAFTNTFKPPFIHQRVVCFWKGAGGGGNPIYPSLCKNETISFFQGEVTSRATWSFKSESGEWERG